MHTCGEVDLENTIEWHNVQTPSFRRSFEQPAELIGAVERWNRNGQRAALISRRGTFR